VFRRALSGAPARHDEFEAVITFWVQPTRHHIKDGPMGGWTAQEFGEKLGNRSRACHYKELLDQGLIDGIVVHPAGPMDDG
jgi:hypothetical protein